MRILNDVLQFLSGLFVHKPSNQRPALASPRVQEFAVLGLGRFGSSLAKMLVERGHTVLGVDSDMALVQQYADEITQTVSIDITDEDALREIDITSYETVIVAIGTNFEANVMATVACKAVGVRNVICKAATVRQREILLKVGADRVVLPEHESGRRLAHELSTPGILDQIRLNEQTLVTELRVPQRFGGCTLADLDIEGKYGLFVAVAARKSDYIVCPPGTYVVQPDDLLVVIGNETEIIRLIAG